MGIAESAHKDSDGYVRIVDVRTANRLLKRETRKIYKLEGDGVKNELNQAQRGQLWIKGNSIDVYQSTSIYKNGNATL